MVVIRYDICSDIIWEALKLTSISRTQDESTGIYLSNLWYLSIFYICSWRVFKCRRREGHHLHYSRSYGGLLKSLLQIEICSCVDALPLTSSVSLEFCGRNLLIRSTSHGIRMQKSLWRFWKNTTDVLSVFDTRSCYFSINIRPYLPAPYDFLLVSAPFIPFQKVKTRCALKNVEADQTHAVWLNASSVHSVNDDTAIVWQNYLWFQSKLQNSVDCCLRETKWAPASAQDTIHTQYSLNPVIKIWQNGQTVKCFVRIVTSGNKIPIHPPLTSIWHLCLQSCP